MWHTTFTHFFRQYHRLLSIITALPLFIIAITGIALSVRSHFEWIQPKVIKADVIADKPILSIDQIMIKAMDESDFDQVIYRPKNNIFDIRYKNDIQKQFHAQTGELLKKEKRRTNFLIRLHEGTFFGKWYSNWILIPTAVVFFFLIFSGVYLFFSTYLRKKI